MTGWCSLWVILALASAKQLMQRRARFARLAELCLLEKEEGKRKKKIPSSPWEIFSFSLDLFIFNFLTDCFPNLISPSPSLHSHPTASLPNPHPRSKHKPQSYGLLWILEYRFLPPPSLPAPFSVLLNTSPSLAHCKLTFSPRLRMALLEALQPGSTSNG